MEERSIKNIWVIGFINAQLKFRERERKNGLQEKLLRCLKRDARSTSLFLID
jgi:hypothetical protein